MSRYEKFRKPRIKYGTKRSAAFDAVLSHQVFVSKDGQRMKLPADEAFLVDLRNKARGGDVAAAEIFAEIQDIKQEQLSSAVKRVVSVKRVVISPGNVSRQLELLRMAKKFDRYSKHAYMKLEPWIVQATLERLGSERLTLTQQRTVFAATRTPHKVNWPTWWEVKGDAAD